ncbi:MAG: DUF4440 domain-containing protein [Blastocatellales bacterium]
MNSLEEQIRQLEERLVNPAVRKSEMELNELFADEFVEVGSSGKIYDKRQTIQPLLEESGFRVMMTNFKILVLSADCVLLSYRAAISFNTDETKTVFSLRSSIWKRNGDQWQIIFHQGTPSNPCSYISPIR